MATIATTLTQDSFQAVFPLACAVCRDMEERLRPRPRAASLFPSLAFCQTCVDEMVGDLEWRCPYCHVAKPSSVRMDGRCLICRGHRFYFERAVAVGNYRGLLRDAILRMKGTIDEGLALNFGRMLGKIWQQLSLPRLDVVMPVPILWTKQMRRAINLTAVIAEGFLDVCRWRFDENTLQLVRATRKQGTLTLPERFENVRGAYRVARPECVAGCHVLVIDDVMTSGATLGEVSRVLREAGAARVWVGAIARGTRTD